MALFKSCCHSFKCQLCTDARTHPPLVSVDTERVPVSGVQEMEWPAISWLPI